MLAASVGLVAVAGAAGCAPRLRMAMAGAYIRDLTAAAARHDDLDLVAEATPACLLMVEGLLAGDPENASLHATAAQLYLVYGSLLEQEAPDRTALAYAHAKQHGLAALAARRDVGALLDRPLGEFVRIEAKLSRRDLPAAFAAAAGWGAWISVHTDSMAALAELPKAEFLMEWVARQDETYMHGGAHLFLGLCKGALPAALGGQPEVARQHFERAAALSGGRSLMAGVFLARYYARQVFDRELYVALLQEVVAARIDTGSELTLQNVAAQRQARWLLEQTDEFF